MIEQITTLLEKFSETTQERFTALADIVIKSTSRQVEEKIWARLPSYYCAENFIRLIPFKDHINIEAKAINGHKELFPDYKLTPQGMLQLYHHQEIPAERLMLVFKETLEAG